MHAVNCLLETRVVLVLSCWQLLPTCLMISAVNVNTLHLRGAVGATSTEPKCTALHKAQTC